LIFCLTKFKRGVVWGVEKKGGVMPWLVITMSAVVGVVTLVIVARGFQISTPHSTILMTVLAAVGGIAGGVAGLAGLIHLHPVVAMVAGAMVGSLFMLWVLKTNSDLRRS
jgi:hypothetical protein